MSGRSLIFEIKNSRPVDLIQLTTALAALGDQFKRFIAEEGDIDADARLYVHEIRAGSIIAELIAFGKAIGDLYEVSDKLAGFVPLLSDMTQAVLNLRPAAKGLDRATVKNIRNIYAPIAVDPGAQLNVIDNSNGTINFNFNVTPPDAATIVYNADHLLNSQLPDEQRFTNEPMTLFQMRNAPPGRTGDYGTIDRFSPKARKLTFMSEEVKDTILHHEGNPFEQVFWVDGVVKTAGGNVVGYQIHALRDVSPKSD